MTQSEIDMRWQGFRRKQQTRFNWKMKKKRLNSKTTVKKKKKRQSHGTRTPEQVQPKRSRTVHQRLVGEKAVLEWKQAEEGQKVYQELYMCSICKKKFCTPSAAEDHEKHRKCEVVTNRRDKRILEDKEFTQIAIQKYRELQQQGETDQSSRRARLEVQFLKELRHHDQTSTWPGHFCAGLLTRGNAFDYRDYWTPRGTQQWPGASCRGLSLSEPHNRSTV